jgi:hypothetical protein
MKSARVQGPLKPDMANEDRIWSQTGKQKFRKKAPPETKTSGDLSACRIWSRAKALQHFRERSRSRPAPYEHQPAAGGQG